MLFLGDAYSPIFSKQKHLWKRLGAKVRTLAVTKTKADKILLSYTFFKLHRHKFSTYKRT